jgi:hypothetical protein
MTKNKRTMLLIFSTMLILGISIAGYFVYQKLKQPVHKAIDAIPTDADFVIKVKSPLSVWKEDLAQTDIWKGISGFEDFNKFENSIHWLDSLIRTDALVSKTVGEHPLYISAHPMTDHSYSALFIYEIPQEFAHGIDGFFTRIAPASNFETSKENDVLTYKNKQQSGINFFIGGGLFVASYSNILLTKSADQLKSKINLMDNPEYKLAALTEGQKTGISIYINHNSLYSRLSKFINKSLNPWILSANDIRGWSNTDVLPRKDLMLMSGFVAASDLSYLHCFKEATPEDATFAKALDENTFYLYSMSIRSTDDYLGKYKEFQQKNHYASDSSKYVIGDSSYSLTTTSALWKKIDPVQLILSASTYSDSVGWTITVKPRDIVIAEQAIIDEMTQRAGTKGKIDTTTYQGFKIGKISLEGSARIFGQSTFSPLDIQYFAVCNNYVQFSSSKKIITRSIDRKKEGKSLDQSYIFKSFCNDINPQAILLIYLSPFEGNALLKNSFDTSGTMGKLLNALATKTPYLGVKIGGYQRPYYPSSLCWKYLINSEPTSSIKEDKIENPEPKQKATSVKKKKKTKDLKSAKKSDKKVNKTVSKKEKEDSKKHKR